MGASLKPRSQADLAGAFDDIVAGLFDPRAVMRSVITLRIAYDAQKRAFRDGTPADDARAFESFQPARRAFISTSGIGE